eukprot:6208858-Pleurochrysis_carterae.AAC.1
MSSSSIKFSWLAERKANGSMRRCDLDTTRPHLNRNFLYGSDANVEGMLKLAQAFYAKELRRAVHHSGESRSRVRTAVADFTDLPNHQVEHDRPFSTSTADRACDRHHQQPGAYSATCSTS